MSQLLIFPQNHKKGPKSLAFSSLDFSRAYGILLGVYFVPAWGSQYSKSVFEDKTVALMWAILLIHTQFSLLMLYTFQFFRVYVKIVRLSDVVVISRVS